MSDPSFLRLGDVLPAGPVVMSVPHAGRVYPSTLLAAARVPMATLRLLEDRHVDYVALRARGAETTLVQTRARAWIDLNRGEDERDPLIDAGARTNAAPSGKLRSGLGLVPRRVGGAGELWRRRFTNEEIDRRIAEAHRPYHQALDDTLRAARARFGVAVLLDVHSMPTLGPGRARIVLGDWFGAGADRRFMERAQTAAAAYGQSVAVNTPYAGGHILQRHGRPRDGIHAIQLELDRTLYLDAALDQPGPGMPAMIGLVRGLLAALADEATRTMDTGPAAQAAE